MRTKKSYAFPFSFMNLLYCTVLYESVSLIVSVVYRRCLPTTKCFVFTNLILIPKVNKPGSVRDLFFFRPHKYSGCTMHSRWCIPHSLFPIRMWLHSNEFISILWYIYLWYVYLFFFVFLFYMHGLIFDRFLPVEIYRVRVMYNVTTSIFCLLSALGIFSTWWNWWLVFIKISILYSIIAFRCLLLVIQIHEAKSFTYFPNVWNERLLFWFSILLSMICIKISHFTLFPFTTVTRQWSTRFFWQDL